MEKQLEFYLIPEPRRMERRNGVCRVEKGVIIEPPAREADRFAAGQLGGALKKDWAITAEIGSGGKSEGRPVITFSASDKLGNLGEEGYRLSISPDSITIESAGAAGAYYAAQTLRQCFRRVDGEVLAPCVVIEDQPALKYRSVHYDTKHHQPTAEYVESFIETLAHYKINVLVWEWEDKFAYEKHPEIGAPGAFTAEQMRAFSRHAAKHHMQIVPLVQGLGHVSYILKHLKFKHLREIGDSNWEFCPLREGSYELLFELWDEAIAATPGSEFLHIGSDETYELGLGKECGCEAKAAEIGKEGLMNIFITRCTEHIEKSGRKVLTWGGKWLAEGKHRPPKTMIFADSPRTDYLQQAKAAGYSGWVYAPNPGIEPLFLPHFPAVLWSMWQEQPARINPGTFHATSGAIGRAARAGVAEGSIATSWDDSGLHNQCWVPRFVNAAEFSWNPAERDIDVWAERFFKNYFGPESNDIRELFSILQESALFFYDTFERRVWHWGGIGKIHVPDFPRGNLEYSNFWRQRYRALLPLALKERLNLDRAIKIIDANLAGGARNQYDLEIYRTAARLMRHNAALILTLGQMEAEVCEANEWHYTNRRGSLEHLRNVEKLIEEHLRERREVFEELVCVWDRTRLPKGLSLPGRPYVYAPDRARHFANRTPDMTYLIMDEQMLDLEGYLERLKVYNNEYEAAIRIEAGA